MRSISFDHRRNMFSCFQGTGRNETNSAVTRAASPSDPTPPNATQRRRPCHRDVRGGVRKFDRTPDVLGIPFTGEKYGETMANSRGTVEMFCAFEKQRLCGQKSHGQKSHGQKSRVTCNSRCLFLPLIPDTWGGSSGSLLSPVGRIPDASDIGIGTGDIKENSMALGPDIYLD